MGSTHTSNEISTDVRDMKEVTKNENASTERSYDCVFCKRGFTNAQALGGHMNIHRKDKAKAKKLSESLVAHEACENFAPISTAQGQFCSALRANKSYQMFASSPNRNLPHGYNPQRVPDRDLVTPYEDLMGLNLSLRIGLPIIEKSKKEVKKEDHEDQNWLENEQVDLELRLGQNPYTIN